MNTELPSRELLQMQADWLADARARIFRLAEIARRKRILDLGSGYGIITAELRRRSSGTVIALDHFLPALSSLQPCVCANARHLPFLESSFDLIFSQNVLLWLPKPAEVIDAVKRILLSGGAWILFEPDYEAMIEFPRELESSPLWIAALKRAGADPIIGRKLPLLLREANFTVRTELLPRLEHPRMERFDFLSGLDLTEQEQCELQRIKRASLERSPDRSVSHLPYFLIIAERS